MAQGTKGQTAIPATPTNGVGVNQKKAKRRAKEAAKRAAEAQKLQPNQPSKNGHVPQTSSAPKHAPPPDPSYLDPETDDPDNFEPAEPEYYSDEAVNNYQDAYGSNGSYGVGRSSASLAAGIGKKSRKKKKSGSSAQQPLHNPIPDDFVPQEAPVASRQGKSKDRIWNTNTTEERERIKEFWLSLGEEERKSLVKIEKEAVLKKMKEQQKHSCSCTVCGRKRTAIEEELEVLYDAYYEELEQYANHQQDAILPPGRYAHPLPSMPPGRHMMATHPPSRIRGLADDESESDEEEEVEEEDYSDDEEDYISDDEPMELPRPAADFFNFGNSLTVKGGILTVADDLLKNDGKKFIEMMEQLAERRMQREEEAAYAAASMSHPNMYKGHTHNHAPPPDEDDYDDEDDEDYDDDEEYEDEEEDEGDTMTEEQRMEEGRRMFQIFAARMFEQRVLTAYREKVAAERQARLLEELAEEDEKKDQRDAKKAKEAQKRKEKKEKQRQAKAEEKARKEAEKAKADAEQKAAEAKKLEEQRKKQEEKRKKKDAEKKAQEEEKQRKDAERLKRQQEQQETERKARELKAQEKKAKEDAKRKEREEREAKEKEVREKKAQEDKERRDRESKAKAEKERLRKEEQATAQNAASTTKRPAQQAPVPIPPTLLKQNSSTGMPSPQVQPAIPKAATPNRPRQSSQQGSHGSSPKTPQVVPGTSKSMSPSGGPSQAQNPIAPKSILTKPPTSQQPNSMPHPQPMSPIPPIGPSPGMPQGMSMGNPPPGFNGFPQAPMAPGMMGPRHLTNHNMPMYPRPNNQGFPFPPPGMPPTGPMPPGRPFPVDGPPGFSPNLAGIGASNPMPPIGMPPHSRQPSGSFDKPSVQPPIGAPSAQPIQPPIKRPSSVKPHEENKRPQGSEMDELAKHLGSKALLDDADDMPDFEGEPRRTSLQAPGMGRTPSLGFGSFPDAPPRPDAFAPFGSSSNPASTWGTPQLPYPSMQSAQGWGNSPTSGVFNNNPFGVMGAPRQTRQSNVGSIRKLLCVACKTHAAQQPSTDGFYDAQELCRDLGAEIPTENEIMEACEVIGDQTTGGGQLYYKRLSESGRIVIKFEEHGGQTAPLGEIGSPIPGHSVPATGGFGARPFPNLGGIGSPNF